METHGECLFVVEKQCCALTAREVAPPRSCVPEIRFPLVRASVVVKDEQQHQLSSQQNILLINIIR